MEKKIPVRESTITPEQIYGLRGSTQNIARTIASASSRIAVSGTAGYAAVFSAANAVGDSQHVFEDATGVGIGTTSPAALLHVYGSALVCGFALDSGASAGKVLTATDSNGNAVWSTPSGGITGAGTSGHLARWNGSSALNNSLIEDDGTDVTVSTDFALRPGATGSARTLALTPTDASQTGSTLYVDHAGTGRSAYIYRNVAGATQPVAEIYQAQASNAQNVLKVTNTGTGTAAGGIYATSVGGTAIWGESTGTGNGIYAYSNTLGGGAPLKVWNDNASSAASAFEVRQDGSGDIINATEDGTERFVVDNGGHIGVTATTGATALTVTSEHRVDNNVPHSWLYVDSFYTFCAYDSYSSNSGHAPFFLIRKARGSQASPSTVSNGDSLGGFAWRAHNGSAFQQRALILCYVDGAVSGSTVPTRMSFFTGTTGANERMRITSDGDVGIGKTTVGARLDIEASNATTGVRINQTSTGKIFACDDNATEVFSVEDGGNTYVQAGLRENVRAVTTSGTTLNTTDRHVMVDTSSIAITVTLPAVATGRRITIKDKSGAAGTRNITINRGGTSLIDGATSKTINTNYGVLDLVSDGTNWLII